MSKTNRQALFSGRKLSLIQRRTYSTYPRNPGAQGDKDKVGLIYYANADTLKEKILSDNKGKSGIYMWTNLISNKRYIGSSVNLKRRLLEYFNVKKIMSQTSMVICRSLYKYGYSKFSLTILEYCGVNDLKEREKYYFDLFGFIQDLYRSGMKLTLNIIY
jgi:hypothetical protein